MNTEEEILAYTGMKEVELALNFNQGFSLQLDVLFHIMRLSLL
ncbi:hypothetical protein PN462_20970 [Spirulina sp. CS-785/01]|nr:hypothetical protein [Spirulina sp. CS-785/01]MDB9315598.1 hypothetical protein [Spirulina sp. CS-785/01]